MVVSLLDDLSETAPSLRRKFDLLLLPAMTSMSDISAFIVGRLPFDSPSKVAVDYADLVDAAYATQGHPRLLSMLGHAMWTQSEGDPARYALTTDALDQMLLTSALMYPHDALPDFLEERLAFIDAVKTLPVEELDLLQPIVAMEEMTLHECALAVLASEWVEKDFANVCSDRVAALDELITSLDDKGLLTRVEDRFSFHSRGFGRAYLRREIAARTGRKPLAPEPSYGSFISARVFERIAWDVGLDSSDEALIRRFLGPIASDDSGLSPTLVTELAEAIRSGDVLALERSPAISLNYSTTPPDDERTTILFVGVTFDLWVDSTATVEMERIELGVLFWMPAGMSPESIGADIEGWFKTHSQSLARYRVTFKRVVAVVAEPDAQRSSRCCHSASERVVTGVGLLLQRPHSRGRLLLAHRRAGTGA